MALTFEPVSGGPNMNYRLSLLALFLCLIDHVATRAIPQTHTRAALRTAKSHSLLFRRAGPVPNAPIATPPRPLAGNSAPGRNRSPGAQGKSTDLVTGEVDQIISPSTGRSKEYFNPLTGRKLDRTRGATSSGTDEQQAISPAPRGAGSGGGRFIESFDLPPHRAVDSTRATSLPPNLRRQNTPDTQSGASPETRPPEQTPRGGHWAKYLRRLMDRRSGTASATPVQPNSLQQHPSRQIDTLRALPVHSNVLQQHSPGQVDAPRVPQTQPNAHWQPPPGPAGIPRAPSAQANTQQQHPPGQVGASILPQTQPNALRQHPPGQSGTSGGSAAQSHVRQQPLPEQRSVGLQVDGLTNEPSRRGRSSFHSSSGTRRIRIATPPPQRSPRGRSPRPLRGIRTPEPATRRRGTWPQRFRIPEVFGRAADYVRNMLSSHRSSPQPSHSQSPVLQDQHSGQQPPTYEAATADELLNQGTSSPPYQPPPLPLRPGVPVQSGPPPPLPPRPGVPVLLGPVPHTSVSPARLSGLELVPPPLPPRPVGIQAPGQHSSGTAGQPSSVRDPAAVPPRRPQTPVIFGEPVLASPPRRTNSGAAGGSDRTAAVPPGRPQMPAMLSKPVLAPQSRQPLPQSSVSQAPREGSYRVSSSEGSSQDLRLIDIGPPPNKPLPPLPPGSTKERRISHQIPGSGLQAWGSTRLNSWSPVTPFNAFVRR